MKEESEQGNRYYRLLFEHMLTGVATCQMLFSDEGKPADFVYLEVNSMFETLTGLKDVVGKKVTEVIPGIKETTPDLFEAYGRVALTGVPERLEIYLPPLRMWFLVSVYSTEKGFFTAVFDNITEQKNREEQLYKAASELKSLMDTVPQILYVLDTQANMIKWNKKTEEATGYSADELAHMIAFELVPENERPDIINAINDAYEKNYVEVKAHLRRKDGTVVPYQWSGAPIRDAKKNDIGIIGIGWDLTEQIKNEEKIKAYELRQRVILDTVPDAIWMKDKEGAYLAVNQAFLKRVGKKREEVIGKTDLDFWSKEYAEKYRADDREVETSRVLKRIVETVPDLQGQIIAVETIKTPAYDEFGALVGIVGVARNISDQERHVEHG